MAASPTRVKASQGLLPTETRLNKASNDNNATYRLTFDDAVDIWLQHWAGRYQHHIAADYRCNAGRINEVLKEKRHVGSKLVAEKKRKASA